MKFICVGDSLVKGYGVEPVNRWSAIVSRNLGIRELNCGINGDTTGGILVRLNDILKQDLRETVIMVMGGANDIISASALSYAEANMQAMMYQIQNSGAIPVVGIMMPIIPKMCYETWGDDCDYNKAYEQINEYRLFLKKRAESMEISYVDFGEILHSEDENSFLFDGLHPNEKAHALIGQVLTDMLGRVVSDNSWESERIIEEAVDPLDYKSVIDRE